MISVVLRQLCLDTTALKSCNKILLTSLVCGNIRLWVKRKRVTSSVHRSSASPEAEVLVPAGPHRVPTRVMLCCMSSSLSLPVFLPLSFCQIKATSAQKIFKKRAVQQPLIMTQKFKHLGGCNNFTQVTREKAQNS